jgi:hypothetical protein
MPCRWNMTPWSIRKHALRQVPIPALLSQRTVCPSFCAAVDRIFPIFVFNEFSPAVAGQRYDRICPDQSTGGFACVCAGFGGSGGGGNSRVRFCTKKQQVCDQPDREQHGCDHCDTVWKYRGRASGIERRWACHFDFRFATRNPAGYPQRCGRSLPHHERAGMRIRRSIARAFVLARQGRIWAERRRGGGGATFHVALPLAAG